MNRIIIIIKEEEEEEEEGVEMKKIVRGEGMEEKEECYV